MTSTTTAAAGAVAAAAASAGVGAIPLLRLGLGSLPEAGGALSEGIRLAALRALRATTPGWRDTENDHKRRQELIAGFSMQALTGGMTNAVFRCSKPSGENQTVLLRSYGKGTEMFFSRGAELRAFKALAERGVGPALLATLEDGRVEQFLEGRALEAKDMRNPTISVLVARRMSELHTLDIGAGDRAPVVFRALKEFHEKALELCGGVHGGVDVVELGELATTLRERLESAFVSDEVVFCHNDLQASTGNIMYNSSSAEGSPETAATTSPTGDETNPSPIRTSPSIVSLIDFEYSGYNPRGFDLGNHFCEWMADYRALEPHVLNLERYPSLEERRAFCRSYLGATNGVADDDVSADEVEALVAEADAYSLASHLLWAMWALLQTKSGAAPPGFDYLSYAAERVRAYRRFSERFLPPLASSAEAAEQAE
ncbi:unnamed protein product [Pylaiella littoralis]